MAKVKHRLLLLYVLLSDSCNRTYWYFYSDTTLGSWEPAQRFSLSYIEAPVVNLRENFKWKTDFTVCPMLTNCKYLNISLANFQGCYFTK